MSAETLPAVYVEPQQGIDVERWASTLTFAAQLAERVHDTDFVPKAMRGNPAAVAACIMYGAEVGVTPMQALAGIHIVDGRPSPSAELMRAMILRAGHSFTIHEMTGTRCRVSGLRRGRPESERVVVDWSLDMARAAGLLGKQNWRNYPRAMLAARAFGDLARLVFPDVVKGLGYVAEDASAAELDAWAPDEPAAPPEPPRKRLQRTQRRKAEPAPADEPSERQNAPAELPPVAPPIIPQPSAARPEPDEPPDEPVETEPLSALPPEVVGDALVEKRAEIAQQHQPTDGDPYDPNDVPLPVTPQPEQTPPEPPAPEAGRRLIGEESQMFRAMQAGLTRELGTVATREERHELVRAILGRDVDSTKSLTVDETRRVLDMLGRFDDGSAKWRLDLGTGSITVVGADEGG